MIDPKNLMAFYSELLMKEPHTDEDQQTLESAQESLKALLKNSGRQLSRKEADAVYWLEAISERCRSRLNG